MKKLKQLIQLFFLSVVLMVFLIPGVGQAKVIADNLEKIFHRPDCSLVKKIKERNIRKIDSEAEAEAKGYFPCQKCIPPARQPSLKIKAIKKLSLPVARETIYIGDRKNKRYHHQWCDLAKALPKKNRIRFQTAKDASEQGYAPCKECNPPVMFIRTLVPIEEDDGIDDSGEEALPEADVEVEEE
ncbi:hypothetical protein K8S19_13140 [bacterium]|nr:hypothetical protein [bacterium]